MIVEIQYKRPESVLVVIYSLTGQVLLLQRRDDPAFWQSVTGSLNPQEREPFAAAKRELGEETGLTPAQGRLLDYHHQAWFDIYPQWLFRYQPGTTRNLEHVFGFEIAMPVAITLSDEHINYCWLEKFAAIEKANSLTNQQAILKFVPDII